MLQTLRRLKNRPLCLYTQRQGRKLFRAVVGVFFFVSIFFFFLVRQTFLNPGHEACASRVSSKLLQPWACLDHMRRSKQEILDHSQRHTGPLFSLPDLYRVSWLKKTKTKQKLQWSYCWEVLVKAMLQTCFSFSASRDNDAFTALWWRRHLWRGGVRAVAQL